MAVSNDLILNVFQMRMDDHFHVMSIGAAAGGLQQGELHGTSK